VNYTAADQTLQAETVSKLFALVERLTWLVESLADLRKQAIDRQSKLGLPLGARDATLSKRVTIFADGLEAHRVSLVAQQEGEGISGEEKLREELGMLYGNVNAYNGRPTKSQIDRMTALSRDLDAAWARFNGASKELTALNAEFTKRKLDPIQPMTEEVWRKK